MKANSKLTNSLKLVLGLAIMLLSLQSCNKKKEENKSGENATEKPAVKPISDLSIYNLPSKWTTQDNKNIEMVDLKGKVLVMVMIYTSCKSACPRLVADMRNIEAHLPENIKKNVKLVLVSIDPEVDTPTKLKAFSIENKMEGDQWLFLRSTEENTREFAAVLAVNYKKIAPMDFSHSNIISVFNAEGELSFQQEGIGVNSDETIKKITEEANKLN
ncbi:SCO family protein [Flavobacterium muglaense]|uniref:SCO family protein n=1 Tax=Flavobacterium muglaense TaxID=2764716 RepID=A0A923MXJ0_9FLAO|nr:SCO family protein [Flavobacterium muglaense]MBC5837617.1 SCO family protein [Flavobacterium muglaense]MBC5844143.1 SCO family protein [Flavobacterium muglaense]